MYLFNVKGFEDIDEEFLIFLDFEGRDRCEEVSQF
jgi:hypothetical protein